MIFLPVISRNHQYRIGNCLTRKTCASCMKCYGNGKFGAFLQNQRNLLLIFSFDDQFRDKPVETRIGAISERVKGVVINSFWIDGFRKQLIKSLIFSNEHVNIY